MSIAVLGSGAFGTALSIAFSGLENNVTLWGRNPSQMHAIEQDPAGAVYFLLPTCCFCEQS